MLEAYQHYFGEYPFQKDGYKLIEVPYSGMEHQSAVTYGNHFANGYLERDWTGVGISPRFDFIIIHESGHEWFGNSVTAADRLRHVDPRRLDDLPGVPLRRVHVRPRRRPEVHQRLQVEGAEPASRSSPRAASTANRRRTSISRARSSSTRCAASSMTTQRWWTLLHDFYQHFKYQNIMTEDVVQYFNQQTGMNLTPIFDQYLRHTALPDPGTEVRRAARARSPIAGRPTSRRSRMPVRVGKQGPLADHPAHHRVADHEDAAQEGRIRSRHRSLFRHRHQTLAGRRPGPPPHAVE